MRVTLTEDILVRMLTLAIECHKQVRIQYVNSSGVLTTRFIEPIKFIDTPEGLGVLTKCHTRKGDYRHFKLSNIKRIMICDYDHEHVLPRSELAL